MLSKAQIQDILSRYFSGKPVLRAYLFGSYARGDADEKSDVDVLVELDYDQDGSIWGAYVAMQDELRQKLGKKVDLVSTDGMSKYIAPFINQDKVLVYER
jgi:predicted nucleotidyltransferase